MIATVSSDVLTDIHDLAHAPQAWDRLQSRFSGNCKARAGELKSLLNNLEKQESHKMEEFLREIKFIADSLASIQSAITDVELNDATIRGLPAEYEPIVAMVQYSRGHITFDEFRTNLIMYEQRVLHLRAREQGTTHQAFVATYGANSRGAPNMPNAGGQGSGNLGNSQGGANQGNKHNNNRRNNKRNRGKGGNNSNANGGHPPNRGHQDHTIQGGQFALTCSVYCNSVMSSCDISSTASSCANLSSAGSYPSGAANASNPNTVCQICFNTGYGVGDCPQRYTPKTRRLMVPAFATFNTGDGNDCVWYPDSAAASHMTPSEGPVNGADSVAGY